MAERPDPVVPVPAAGRRPGRPWPALIVIPLAVLLCAAASVIGLGRPGQRTAIDDYLPADGTPARLSVLDGGRVNEVGATFDLEQALLPGGDGLLDLANTVSRRLPYASVAEIKQGQESRWLRATVNSYGPDPRPLSLSLPIIGDTVTLIGERGATGFTLYQRPWEVLSPRLLTGRRVPIDGSLLHDGSEERVTGSIGVTASGWIDGCLDSTAEWSVTGRSGTQRRTLVFCPAAADAPAGIAGLVTESGGQPTGAVWAGETPVPPGDPTGVLEPRPAWTDPPAIDRLTFAEEVAGLRPLGDPSEYFGALTDGTLVTVERSGDVLGSRRIPGTDPSAEGTTRYVLQWRARPGGVITAIRAVGSMVVVATTAKRLVGYGGDGRRLWTVPLGDVVSGLDAQDGRLLVRTVDGTVRLIELGSGTVRWEERVDGEPLRSSALAGPVAVALTRDGELVALGRSDGKERWKAEDEGSRAAGVIGTELILQVGPDRILGRSAADGSVRWSVPARGFVLGSWTTSGDDPIGIVATTAGVRGYDAAGRVRWQRPPADTVAVAGDLVVLATATGAELRDVHTGEVLRHWDYRVSAVPAAVFAETGVILKWNSDVEESGLVMLR